MAVGRDTQFSHVVLLRFVQLLTAFPLLGTRGWRLWAALLLERRGAGDRGGVGHAGATGGVPLVWEGLHLLAALQLIGGLGALFGTTYGCGGGPVSNYFTIRLGARR